MLGDAGLPYTDKQKTIWLNEARSIVCILRKWRISFAEKAAKRTGGQHIYIVRVNIYVRRTSVASLDLFNGGRFIYGWWWWSRTIISKSQAHNCCVMVVHMRQEGRIERSKRTHTHSPVVPLECPLCSICRVCSEPHCGVCLPLATTNL